MTRAETIAAIKEHWGEPASDCPTPLAECDRCAIAWLLQEIAWLNTQLNVSRDGRAVLAAELEYLRMAGISK